MYLIPYIKRYIVTYNNKYRYIIKYSNYKSDDLMIIIKIGCIYPLKIYRPYLYRYSNSYTYDDCIIIRIGRFSSEKLYRVYL